MRGFVRAFVLCVGLWACAGTAYAQATGGSFGGGNFGGGGSSSSSSGGGGGGGFSSSHDWSSSGSHVSTGGGGSCLSSVTGLFCLLVIFGVIVLAQKLRGNAGGARASGPTGGYAPNLGTGMHATAITLGIDWRARRDLQAHLARLAATGQAGTPQGRANLLREAVLALRRAEISWLYVAYRDGGVLAPQQAEQAFHQMGNDARARFRSELVRGAGAEVVQQAAPEMRANKNEGQGTVVVTLIVVARRPLAGVANIQDANQIRFALDDRATLTAEQLVALEVVWSPAAENDRMSTSELEQHYPELRLIDPNSIAGRVFCQFCQGPYPMELLNCPHCGAPAPKQPGQG